MRKCAITAGSVRTAKTRTSVNVVAKIDRRLTANQVRRSPTWMMKPMGRHHFAGTLFVFTLLASSSIVIWSQMVSEPVDPVGDRVALIRATVPHPAISIDGNADFASQASSEGWPGNGQKNNPYVISGYEINGMGYLCGILVGNTTHHFRVQDCYIHDAMPTAIFLYNVVNGVLDNNTCTSNLVSSECIVLVQSSSNTVSNSTCTGANNGFGPGIHLIQSGSNRLVDNTCRQIYVGSSSGNIVADNICLVSIYGSDHTVTRNLCRLGTSSGFLYGIYASGQNITIADNVCNSNTEGIGVYGSLNHVRNNSCAGNDQYGIELNSQGTVVENNFVTGSGRLGILVWGDNITVANNTCVSCHGPGISNEAWSPSLQLALTHSTIRNNTCTGNWRSGILLQYASDDSLVENNCSGNQMSGISMYMSPRQTLTANLCSGNTHAGIFIDQSQRATLRDNTMFNDGISIQGQLLTDWALHDIDGSNTVNTKPVAFVLSASGSEIAGGYGQVIMVNCVNVTVRDQGYYNASVGVVAAFSSLIKFSNISSMGNVMYGLEFYSSHDSTVENCSLLANRIGLNLTSSSDRISVRHCDFVNNTESGLTLNYSTTCEIDNSSFSANKFGIVFRSSDSNTVTGNAFIHNQNYAVYMPYYYGVGEVYFPSSFGNAIYNNTFFENNRGLVQAYVSSDTNSFDKDGRGNYWSDWTSPDTVEPFGIVDSPYVLNGGSGAQDNYPLTMPMAVVPEFSSVFAAIGSLLIMLIARRAVTGQRNRET